jgi:hypothetical protein
MNAALSEPMKRNDVNVKLDAEVATDAKMVASARGIPMAQYLSELIRPLVRRDLESEMAKRLRQSDPKPRKSKGPE